ncbi:MAG: hypothetical protein RR270_07965 [Alistipes sp.]
MKALLLLQGGFFLCAVLLRAIAELVEGFSPIPELVEGSGARGSRRDKANFAADISTSSMIAEYVEGFSPKNNGSHATR